MKIKDEYRPADKKEDSFGVTEEFKVKGDRKTNGCNFKRFATEMRRRQDSIKRQESSTNVQQFWE